MLVVGAGPSGLSAAYHLARRGHEVEIRDAGAEPGGMMRYGIPAYRLPRDVLAGELGRIEALGVRMTCGHRVTDLAAERRRGRFDAVFVAVGAHLSKHVDIPARDAEPDHRRGAVPAGVSRAAAARWSAAGSRCTAAVTPRWTRPGSPAGSGAEDTMIVYRRNREQMPAHEEEAVGRRAGGRADQLAAHHHRLRGARADRRGHGAGRRRAGRSRPGGCETLAADTIILAVGQDADTAFLRAVPGVEFKRDGTVVVVAGR